MWKSAAPLQKPAPTCAACPTFLSLHQTILVPTMASRPSRAIPIPLPRSSRRRPGEPSFPGPGVDPLAVPQTQPSFPSRSESSHAYYAEPISSSLIFSMDPERPEYSVHNAPTPLYDLPRFARPRNPGNPLRCRRCGQLYYQSTAPRAHTDDRYPLCQQCQGRAAPHAPTRLRADTMVATDYIPAWHRSAGHPADVLQPSYGECLRLL